MRKSHFTLFFGGLLLLVIGLSVSWTENKESPEQMIASAKALDQQFVESFSKGDVDGVMATYWNSPDLVSYPPDSMEVRGWQAAKDALAQSFSQMPGASLELLESNNKVEGDVVLGFGKWRLTITPPEGDPMVINGRYTDVKAKRDGKWVYILDHASVPLPPPPEEAEK